MIEIVEWNGYIFQMDKERPNLRFKGGGSPELPEQKPIEVVTNVEDLKNKEVQRQKRRSYIAGGKQSTMLSGTQTRLAQRLDALKTKLGE